MLARRSIEKTGTARQAPTLPGCALAVLAVMGAGLYGAAQSHAATVRLWTEVAAAPMGASPDALRKALRGAKLKKVKARGKGRTALTEKVVFERHTPATVTYRFFRGRLFEVELRYLKKGRVERMASLLKKKYGTCKKKGKSVVCAVGGRRIALRPAGGKVVVYFTSPKVLAAALPPKKKPDPEPSDDDEVAPAPAAKPEPVVVAVASPAPTPPAPTPPTETPTKPPPDQDDDDDDEVAAKPRAVTGRPPGPSRGRVVRERADDPKLWDALGVKSGRISVFALKLAAPKRRKKAATHHVVAGFRRDGGEPLAGIVSRGDGVQIVHLGLGCPGTPSDAKAMDFRLDGTLDVAVFYGARGEPQRVALVPFAQRFAGAKFIGGRFGGRNAFRCYRIGGELEQLDFRDVDRDKSIDLLLTYRHEGAGVVHDVYFFQGNDFYFRETRPGAPQPLTAK